MERLNTENKMGVMPVGKLLLSMATPVMLSMLVQACYNIVDSIYVSQISENALTAVSMAFPVQNLMIGFATGTGVGMNALLSRSLGCGDREKANRAAGNGAFLAAVWCLMFMVLGGLFSRTFYDIQTDTPEIAEGGGEYLRICSLWSFGLFGAILFERMLQATGRTVYTMFTQATGAILNILLDPLFIFGGFGIPAMGVAGAAVATVLGQMASFVLGMVFHFLKNRDIRLRWYHLKPSWPVLKPILGVGIPSVIMVAVGSVMNFTMNWILRGFSNTAVAVFGAFYKLQSFILMPIIGLNNAMVSIVAFNYGAGSPRRIKKTVMLSCLIALGFALVGLLSFELTPDLLLGMFEPSEEFLEIGRPALRIIGWHYVMAAFCIVFNSVFQALGNGIYATITSMARQLVVLLPVAWLLSLTGELRLVWWAFPIAEVVSLLVSSGLLLRLYRSKIRPLSAAA